MVCNVRDAKNWAQRHLFLDALRFRLASNSNGFAVDMPMFLVFRVLTGFFGSPSWATGGATIADIYDPARVEYGICLWGLFGVRGVWPNPWRIYGPSEGLAIDNLGIHMTVCVRGGHDVFLSP
jgi:hypothetical protein